MDDLLRAVVLGVIEGLTEFLPISSTGHLILARPFLGIRGDEDPWPAFLYFVQIGAILAVVLHFFRPLWRQTFQPIAAGWRNHVLVKIAVGTLPGAVLGLAFNNLMERYLERELPVALALILGAAAIVLIERRYRRIEGPGIEQVTLRQAFLIGIAQCVAIIPGTSRSMATIMGGLLVGLPAATAAEFSFYLAIPTLLGAGTLRVLKRPEALGSHFPIMTVGFVSAFLVAWAVVAGFMHYVQNRSFTPFAIYRTLLGLVVLTWWLAAEPPPGSGQ